MHQAIVTGKHVIRKSEMNMKLLGKREEGTYRIVKSKVRGGKAGKGRTGQGRTEQSKERGSSMLIANS